MQKVLILEPREIWQNLWKPALEERGFIVLIAWSTDQAEVILERNPGIAAIAVSARISGRTVSPEFVKKVRSLFPEIKIIITSGDGFFDEELLKVEDDIKCEKSKLFRILIDLFQKSPIQIAHCS